VVGFFDIGSVTEGVLDFCADIAHRSVMVMRINSGGGFEHGIQLARVIIRSEN